MQYHKMDFFQEEFLLRYLKEIDKLYTFKNSFIYSPE